MSLARSRQWKPSTTAGRTIANSPTHEVTNSRDPSPWPGTWIAYKRVVIADQLRARTRQFALDVIVLCSRLGLGDLARVVRPQLLRAATGIAANYRAACRSRSLREFVSRLAVVVEECDEAELWLDVVETMALGDLQRASMLRKEAAELLAVMSSSRRTALQRLKQGHGK